MKVVNKWLLISSLIVFGILGCESPVEKQDTRNKKQDKRKKKQLLKERLKNRTTDLRLPPSQAISNSGYQPVYPWQQGKTTPLHTIQNLPTPNGYVRKALGNKNQFGQWLRRLPIQPKGAKVYLYNGRKKPYQKGAYAVIDIDVGKRDLQQCADAVMRLKAEYHYGLKDYQNIHFKYTSGHNVAFEDWRKGKRPQVSGSSVQFTSPNGKTDNSYLNFKKYMQAIFTYAGTASLTKELKRVPIADMQIGDVFIQGGFPGHAIIVVDMAVHPKTEKKVFMVAQSYMPAQSIHVLNNLNDRTLGAWYQLDFEGELDTPEWSFSKGDLKRFQ